MTRLDRPTAGARRLATGHLRQTSEATAGTATVAAQSEEVVNHRQKAGAEAAMAPAAALSLRVAAGPRDATRLLKQSLTRVGGEAWMLTWICRMIRCGYVAQRCSTQAVVHLVQQAEKGPCGTAQHMAASATSASAHKFIMCCSIRIVGAGSFMCPARRQPLQRVDRAGMCMAAFAGNPCDGLSQGAGNVQTLPLLLAQA